MTKPPSPNQPQLPDMPMTYAEARALTDRIKAGLAELNDDDRAEIFRRMKEFQ